VLLLHGGGATKMVTAAAVGERGGAAAAAAALLRRRVCPPEASTSTRMTSGGSGDLLLFANKDGQLHGQDKVFPIIQFLFFALLPCHVPNIFSQTCADFWRAVVLDQLFKLEEKIHASASHLLLCVKQTENAENMSLFEAPFDGGWRVRFKHYLENVTDKLPRQTDRAALGRALEQW
jgi:hypothetical protein